MISGLMAALFPFLAKLLLPIGVGAKSEKDRAQPALTRFFLFNCYNLL
jgi:hypothetical protein